MQESRAIVYLAAMAIGLALRVLGVLDVPYGAALAVGGIGLLSALALREIFRRAWRRSLARATTPVWLGVDIVLVSWIVAVTGGQASPWFPWYVAIISAAAFVAGQLAAFAAFLACTGGYVVALVVAGDVAGIDQPFWNGVGVMVCLYAASYFFLRGAVMLKRRGERIRAMEKESRRKVGELTRLTEALEERGRELREANLRLREADRLKTQFLANVSHELRTPLNSIIGFSEILGTQLQEDLDERQQRFLDYIQTAGEELLSIINDILDLSKIEAGTMEMAPEKVPVASSLHGVRTILKGAAKKRDVKITVEIGEDLPVVEADPVRFKQMVYHLLSNAVKFSHPGEEVRLEGRAVEADESPLGVECVEIRVVDQGIGIDPAQREAIFEAFRQADGTASREFQGAGLGLALVRRVVELHRGLVGVESQVGKGSTFSVLWPVKYRGKGPSGGDVVLPGTDSESDGRRILVVEDDPTAYETLRRPLEEAGFRSVRARSGEEALEMARKFRPAAITLDLVLPGIDGLKVLRRLRSSPETREIPVVIVSLLDNRELGLALGADDYLVKPVDEDALLSRLREL
ncbi:MAG: ATP-binding protein, partial [Thermoanaerobaculia bacterium]|nr:ATP-binding protein [Thermoanaerobaculia bacterium]